jgi:hypothetical protein
MRMPGRQWKQFAWVAASFVLVHGRIEAQG